MSLRLDVMSLPVDSESLLKLPVPSTYFDSSEVGPIKLVKRTHN
jgi:hypothetical protein